MLDGTGLLYREWFTLDTVQEDTALQVMSLWLVIANVGGIQQVFLLFTVWIFSYYSLISFQIEAINELFKV